MKHILLAISGPSGVGKGTLVNMLLERNDEFVSSVSCTTRAPREGERESVSYFFLSEEEFRRRIQADDFLEYDEHFGHYYGTPASFVRETLRDKSVILEIDVHGALNAKKRLPQTVTLFVAPPSAEALALRLKGRGSETEEQIKTRLARAEYELSFADRYDYVVVNDDLERAYREILSVVRREENRQE